MLPLDEVYLVIASQVVDDSARPDPIRTGAHASRARPTDVPSWVRSFGQCVIDHESRNWPYDGNPRPYDAVRSDDGTASGAYQFTDGTWRAVSARSGHPGWDRAYLAPPAVQDAVFAWTVLHEGTRHWNGTHCGHGT